MDEMDILQQREYKVVKSNEMVRKAKNDLTLSELKIMNYIFSKVKPTDAAFTEYKFFISDYLKVCGLSASGNNYEDIKAALKSIRDKSFWLLDENNQEVLIGWLNKVWVRKNSGMVKVRLDEDLQKYIIGLYDNYTQYSLLCQLPMTSSYSIKLFELLESYSGLRGHTFELDDLKRLLSAEHYVNFKDFRIRVIEIAMKEINLYTDLKVTWEPIKKGRKVEKIKFFIGKKTSIENAMTQASVNSRLDGQINMFEYMDVR